MITKNAKLDLLKKLIVQDEKQKGDIRKILHVNCGRGSTTLALAQIFPDAHIIGISRNEEDIRSAYQECAILNKIDNVSFLVMDAEEDLSMDRLFILEQSRPDGTMPESSTIMTPVPLANESDWNFVHDDENGQPEDVDWISDVSSHYFPDIPLGKFDLICAFDCDYQIVSQLVGILKPTCRLVITAPCNGDYKTIEHHSAKCSLPSINDYLTALHEAIHVTFKDCSLEVLPSLRHSIFVGEVAITWRDYFKKVFLTETLHQAFIDGIYKYVLLTAICREN